MKVCQFELHRCAFKIVHLFLCTKKDIVHYDTFLSVSFFLLLVTFMYSMLKNNIVIKNDKFCKK